jgi:hypothetical protein
VRLRGVTGVASSGINMSRDWLGTARTGMLAWGLPHAALVLGLFVDVPARTAIWLVALAWMSAACLLNARRCGRTHCRFTGPYYLAMMIPVLVFGSGLIPVSLTAWIVLGTMIVLGSKLIWWGTERALGKFS